MSDSNIPPRPPIPGGDNGASQPNPPYQPGGVPQSFGQPTQPSPPQFGVPQPGGFAGQNGPSNFGGQNGLPPYGQPPQGGDDSKKLLWIILAGVGVLLVAAAIVWAFVWGPFSSSDKADGKDDKISSDTKDGGSDTRETKKPAANVSSGRDAVEAYLNALASGDATTAIGFLQSKPTGDLVKDEVVAASVKLAPITNIVVEGDSDYKSTATFNVGSEEVSMDFTTTKSGKNYKIRAIGGGNIYLPSKITGAGLQANGIDVNVSGTSADAFPIMYKFSSSSKYLELTGDTEVIPYTYTSATNLEISLTDEGKNVAREAVKASVASCLAEKTLASSCGMDVKSPLSGGETVAEGSVNRVMPASKQSKLDTMELNPDYKNPLMLSTYESFRPDITATCTKTSGESGTCSIIMFGGSKRPMVDLSKDPVAVSWE